MSVPPEVMQRLSGGAGGGAPPPEAGGMPAQPGGPKPAAAPMAKPQKNEGMQEAARVNVHIAMNMLEQALPAFGSESKEGKAILKHLSGLSKDFGESDSGDLVPAQVSQMVRSLPQAGGGTDVQKMLQKMQGGGAPGGQPQPGMPQPQPQAM